MFDWKRRLSCGLLRLRCRLRSVAADIVPRRLSLYVGNSWNNTVNHRIAQQTDSNYASIITYLLNNVIAVWIITRFSIGKNDCNRYCCMTQRTKWIQFNSNHYCVACVDWTKFVQLDGVSRWLLRSSGIHYRLTYDHH